MRLAGLRGFIEGLGLVDRGDVEFRFDLDQQIALFDLLAFLDGEVNDLAADLGADLDLEDGLDAAVGGDDLGQVAPRDFLGLDGDDNIPFLEYHHRRQAHQDNYDG